MSKFTEGNQFGKISKRGVNKVSQDMRESFLELLQNNLPQMQEDLNELKPYERVKIILDIASYCIPRLKAVEVKTDNSSEVQPVEITIEEARNIRKAFDLKY